MLRRFGLALLAIASLAGGARAQSVDVPKALGQLRGGMAEEGIDLARSEVEARLTPYPCPPRPSRARARSPFSDSEGIPKSGEQCESFIMMTEGGDGTSIQPGFA
jgi:hypothetical protein